MLQSITPTSVGVFVRLVVRNSQKRVALLLYHGTTHKDMNALRQTLRQYTALCLITQMLTQIGLQVPIKTIRQ